MRKAAALQKRGRHSGGLVNVTRVHKPLEIRPGVTLPITAAFMLAEGDARTRPPIILVDDNAGRRWVGVALVSMPTNVPVADNRGRSGYRRRSQNGRARGCTE